MTEDLMRTLYMKLILEELPKEIKRIENANLEFDRQFGDLADEIRESYEAHTYSISQNYLDAAKDALFTIQLLRTTTGDEIQIQCTINGLGALLRQALECLAYAQWLTSDMTKSTLHEKGFLVYRKNILDGLDYYRQIGDTAAIKKGEELQESSLKEGLSSGYLAETVNAETGKVKIKQRIRFPGATETCKTIQTNRAIINAEVLNQYPGMSNAGFLFIWASGLTHGRHWVTRYTASVDGRATTRPNYLNINLALFTIFELLKLVCRNQENIRLLNLPEA